MKRIFFLIISILTLTSAYSSPNTSNTFKLNYNVESYGKDPGATPEQVAARLEALGSEIDLRYNSEVQKYIDTYVKQAYGRKKVTSLLVLSAYYMPIFEQALKEAGLPTELKYLPVIESGLDPKATSRQGAAGLWQFVPVAAKGYDMKIGTGIDERRDPYISSEKACKMLKDLYNKFGDWTLVLAAYNSGPGTVQKALKRAGGDRSKHTFWTISSYLPAETRKYVPMFIAMTYIMSYYGEHNIPAVAIAQPFTSDTVKMTSKVNLRTIASTVGVSVEDLRTLNPHFRTDVVTPMPGRPCNLILPTANAQEYKQKLGHPIEETKIYTESAPAEKKDVKKSEAKPERPRRQSQYAYDNKPSQMMPNTYVRTRRTEDSSRRKRKDGNEDTDITKLSSDSNDNNTNN